VVIASACCSPALRKADAAVIFDAAVDRKAAAGRPARKDARRELALEGDVVHGHHGA
jgi:hypothetical protein